MKSHRRRDAHIAAECWFVSLRVYHDIDQDGRRLYQGDGGRVVARRISTWTSRLSRWTGNGVADTRAAVAYDLRQPGDNTSSIGILVNSAVDESMWFSKIWNV